MGQRGQSLCPSFRYGSVSSDNKENGVKATKKPAPSGRLFRFQKRFLLCAGDLAGLHAAGAHVGAPHAAVLVLDGDLLHVRTEHAVRHSVGVADAATGDRMLPANLTYLRHLYQLHVRLGSNRLMTKKP